LLEMQHAGATDSTAEIRQTQKNQHPSAEGGQASGHGANSCNPGPAHRRAIMLKDPKARMFGWRA
jgi:hypothetical protein